MQINARNSDVFFRWWSVTPSQCLRMVPVFAFLIRRNRSLRHRRNMSLRHHTLQYCYRYLKFRRHGEWIGQLYQFVTFIYIYIFWICICLSIQVPGAIIIATKIIQCCRWFSKIEMVSRQLHPSWQLIYWYCLFLHDSQLRLLHMC